jgi:uncharacterized membrane protein YeaQ/YmgE (transglycosylase-associated protein family)
VTRATAGARAERTPAPYAWPVLLVVLVVCIVLFVVLPFLGATLWSLLSTLLIGLLLGALARLIVPGRTNIGVLTTSLIGVAGGLLGTLLSRLFDTGSFGRLLLQIGAAVALVLFVRPEPVT